MAEKAKHPIQSDETLLGIIEGLERFGEAQVTELAEEVDVSKSTVHNHLSTLRENGYVVKESGKYFLSFRFLQLGEHTRTRTDLYEIARPQIDSLARETGTVANLAVEQRGRGVYLYRSLGDQTLRFSTSAGGMHELHATATGKSMLAWMPEERIDEIVEVHGLPERGPNTITARSELDEHLTEVRDRGVAFDDEEYGSGLRCIGAPIRGTDGDVLGAVSVSGPVASIDDDEFTTEFPEAVHAAANLIEVNLKGY